ncbi:hypothetical protein METBIDRAFT_78180 [Metschnikowia bicuspidata var. bicuspidata NRRL YB-4993]|uniref:DUF1531-domain-containing protein n=1 Tax=Metschnikowia bicuspidata var. bicuspidata NRRL YB-4993 TaxID=869754 RepID=A0A1A0HAG2_9ASCO|nr:hypothetical protein METBIDRAFT_78180 [Metschnikowia bicuspidata var. bicuspidata NRRL YB-4993]OBA21119.1 hypothetical protein METBIDRAFT_78180 [Metschnikowia bicuspidata var. bicuspidata NRRL YB-4993]
METPAAPLGFVYDYVEKQSLQKYLRLVIIVCIYIFARGYYSNWAKQRHIRTQLAIDKREKELDAQRKERDESEKFEELDREATSFGWGKATRRNVKRQEQVLQDAAQQLRERHQGEYDAAEDHDIDDLLDD